MNFQRFHNAAIHAYSIGSLALIIAGFVGSLLGLIILSWSKSMKTPSFNYHKALIAADFVFCANWLFTEIIDPKVDSDLSKQFHFRHYFPAYYSGVVARVVASTCGYMNLYLTLWVAMDRFLALNKPVFYYGFNRDVVGGTIIVASFALSFSVHSWSPWFERSVIHQRQLNATFYAWHEVLPSPLMGRLFKIKETYNSILRISFPILLTVLTFGAIWQFIKVGKKRRKICLSRKYNGRQRRREKFLFVLMISVVLLAFIQVLPREALRLLDFIYPSTYLRAQVLNNNNTLLDRVYYFRLQLYGHEVMKIVMNTCTAITRCSLFYLYLALNQTFRKAFRRTLKRAVCMNTTPDFTSLFASRARATKPVPSARSNNFINGRMGLNEHGGATPLIEIQDYCEYLRPEGLRLSPWNFLRKASGFRPDYTPGESLNDAFLQTQDDRGFELMLMDSGGISKSTSFSSL